MGSNSSSSHSSSLFLFTFSITSSILFLLSLIPPTDSSFYSSNHKNSNSKNNQRQQRKIQYNHQRLPQSHFQSRQQSPSSQCHAQGGTCEPMLSCLLTLGFVSGSCGGFLNVCCAQPVNRYTRESISEAHSSPVGAHRRLWTSFVRPNPLRLPSSHSHSHSSYKHQQQPSQSGGKQHQTFRLNPQQVRSSRSMVSHGRSNSINFLNQVNDFGPVVNDPQCGRPPSASTTGNGLPVSTNRRVLDGQPAGFGSFPWQALIRIGKGKCGGVLINRRHVVTAGHCVKNKPLNAILVSLGEYHLKMIEPLPGQNFRVSRARVHPKFQFSPAADRFDVAVLTLDRPVRYAPHISPICLPEAGRDPEPGTNAYVAGWGALIPDDITGPLIQFLVPEIKRPSVLQVVNVPVLENERCERWHRNQGIKVTIWPEMVCAGYRQGGKDSCKGDSGGPLMVQQADGRWVLIGLVSAGFSCGKPGQPGIYHRISATSDWITYNAYNHRYF